MKLSGDTLTDTQVRKIVKTLGSAYGTAQKTAWDIDEGEIGPDEAADALNAMFDALKAALDDERHGFDNPLSEICEQMLARGGSFVQSLAASTRLADPENLAKILTAWPEVFERYDAIASLEAAKNPKLL
jgi:hypothetical protein